jgi:hypothetical protein
MQISTKNAIATALSTVLITVIGFLWVEVSDQGKISARYSEAAIYFKEGYSTLVRYVDSNDSRLNSLEVDVGILRADMIHLRAEITRLQNDRSTL